jgi:hypothetical protein
MSKRNDHVTARDFARDGAKLGAWSGGFLGLLAGTGVLPLPAIGPIFVASALEDTLWGTAEGALAGAALGWMVGALYAFGMSTLPRIHRAILTLGALLFKTRIFDSSADAGMPNAMAAGDGRQMHPRISASAL